MFYIMETLWNYCTCE